MLDSWVLIAASISRAGVCAAVLEDVLTHHDLILSDFIFGEVAKRLREKFQFPTKEVRALLQFLKRTAASVEPSALDPSTCRDPDDLPILGTAIAGKAEMLVTVDKDLLTLRTFRGIAIVKPGEFWKRSFLSASEG